MFLNKFLDKKNNFFYDDINNIILAYKEDLDRKNIFDIMNRMIPKYDYDINFSSTMELYQEKLSLHEFIYYIKYYDTELLKKFKFKIKIIYCDEIVRRNYDFDKYYYSYDEMLNHLKYNFTYYNLIKINFFNEPYVQENIVTLTLLDDQNYYNKKKNKFFKKFLKKIKKFFKFIF